MADDLFVWLDALYNKRTPQGTPPIHMMHRFMASSQPLAQACQVLRQQVRDPHLVFKTWQGLLPKGPGAPRFQYAAAKRPPAAEGVVARIMEVHGYRREEAEQAWALLLLCGKHLEACAYYGVEETGDDVPF